MQQTKEDMPPEAQRALKEDEKASPATVASTSKVKPEPSPSSSSNSSKPYLYKNVCCLSDWLYLFAIKILDQGTKKPFSNEDLFPIDENWHYDAMYPDFEKNFNENRKNKWGFKSSFFLVFRRIYLWTISEWLVGTFVGLLGPIFIRLFVKWMASPDSESPSTSGNGWLYGGIIILTTMIRLILKRRSMFLSFIMQFQVGQCLRGLVYNKFNKLTTEAIRNLDVGKISNTLSSDIWQIQVAMRMSQTLFVTPAIIISISIYMIIVFNAIALVVPAAFFTVLLVQATINRFTVGMIKRKKELADRRSKFINEVITGIKNIKFQAWEDQVLKKVEAIRSQEVKILQKYITLRLVAIHMSEMAPTIAVLSFFFFYGIVAGNNFGLAESYLVVSFVNQINGPMRMLTMSLDMFSNAGVSLNRIENVVCVPEKTAVPDNKSLKLGEILFEDFSGGWFSEAQTKYFKSNENKINNLAISDINLRIQPGRLYAVLGEVGSGKSSLLLAALHDLICKRGNVSKNGSVAFISQSPFLLNASIKDNILFYSKYEEERYKECLLKSCLLDDIKQLPGGDLTEIGERGINLSGGQKQRITIARALYANRDIYLVDDCLSALDAEVGKKIFYNIFKKTLKGKTIVMVTHATSVLPDVDEIILLKGGRLTLQGSYEEIKSNPIYLEYYQAVLKSEEQAHGEDGTKSEEVGGMKRKQSKEGKGLGKMTVEELQAQAREDEEEYKKQKEELERLFVSISEKRKEDLKKKGGLTKKEGRSVGMVNGKYLWYYMKAYLLPLFFVYNCFGASFVAVRVFSDYWMGLWARHSTSNTDGYMCFVLAMLNLSLLVAAFCMSQIHSRGIMNASYTINLRMTKGVLRNKNEFFDVTPIGVIMNRFTKDVDIMDGSLANFITQFQSNFFNILAILLLMMITVPFMIVLVVVAAFVFFRISKRLLTCSSDLRRLSLIAGSPILSNVQEALGGNLIISSYGVFDKLKRSFVDNLVKLGQIELHERFMQSYVFQLIELVCALLLMSVIILVVLIKIYQVKIFQDPNVLALAINYTSLSTDWIGMLLFAYQELNTGINCIERLVDLATPTKEEPNFDEPQPRQNWPESGLIELSHVDLRYREGLPLVLKDLSLTIQDKEKVGIVGRTGSGKSTMILALKRMVDPMQKEDSFIKVDHTKIDSMGLKYYRKAICLIPQDPFLLSGTVRSNIDPDSKYTVDEIVDTLKKTQIFENLYDTISRVLKNDHTTVDGKDLEASKIKGKEVPKEDKKPVEMTHLIDGDTHQKNEAVLSYEIKEGGNNISQGQRQLLCIARALISKPKILLMDEATANIDSKTDQIIQKIIKNEFKNSTVLTIAHRLNTIVQYDRVVVLKAGEIIEVDTPASLLEKQGLFKEMVMELGDKNFMKMKEYANNKELDPVLE